MRVRVLLLAVLALAVAGSAAAASSNPKLVRVVKRHGTIKATLTYTQKIQDHDLTLSVRRGGALIVRRRICPIDLQHQACFWHRDAWWIMKKQAPFTFRLVAGARTPAVVLNLWTGGAHCCENTFIALAGRHPAWIAHDWENPGYHGKRLGGRYYFVSGDDRFDYAFAAYAFSWAPAQVWTIRGEQLVDVTRSVPQLVEADARRAWKAYLGRWGRRNKGIGGIGALAGWCADQYVLGKGRHCEQVLHTELAAGYLKASQGLSGERFIRTLNRDLERWGYKRR